MEAAERLLPGQVSASSAWAMNELCDIMDVGCAIVDAMCRVVHWNNWMTTASGHPASEVVGKDLFDLYPQIRNTRRERALQQALAGEAVVLAQAFHEYFLEMNARASDGVPCMQQSVRLIPFIDDAGSNGAVILIQDVTERIVRERELTEAKERAESASKAKSDFLAAISHELRTPLTAILGYADLLEGQIGGTLNESQHEYISRITAGAWHLIKIIEEILTFSTVEAHKYEVVLETVDVVDVVRQTVALLEESASRKKIELSIDAKDDQLVIETDPLKLRQILLNIIGNAIKFTDAGSVTVQVDRDSENLFVAVLDTGRGIPERMRSLIFEPFVQVDQSSTRAKGGTGLGLPLSRNLAELLGGGLTLEGSSANGSKFLLRLPLTSIPAMGSSEIESR